MRPPPTAPLANEFVIAPWFSPTRPPAEAKVPPLTAPAAEEADIDPRFLPTSPPTSLEFPPLTWPLADELLMAAPARFRPTRPPSTIWVAAALLTAAEALELAIVPPF